MWTQSVVDGDKEMLLYIDNVLEDGGSVVSAVYAAMVIDYRLLCCLLFAELAIQVEGWDFTRQHPVDNRVVDQQTGIISRVATSQYTGIGYMVGMTMIILQSLNALEYVIRDGKSAIGPWVAVFGILADVFVIILGMILFQMVSFFYNHELLIFIFVAIFRKRFSNIIYLI